MKTLLDFKLPASKKAKKTEHESCECNKNKTSAKEGNSMKSAKTLKDFGQSKSRKEDLDKIPQNRIDQKPLPPEIREHHSLGDISYLVAEDNGNLWYSSPDVEDYLEALRAYPAHPDYDEANDPFENQDLLIDKIMSGGFSDPHNPPSPMEFYEINSRFYKTLKTVDPCDFIWDTAENYALAKFYSMSGLVESRSMYLEHAAFYAGCLVESGLIDPKLVERELFETGFGLCVEEILDQADIQDMEDEIRRTRRIIDKNMQLGSQIWRSGSRYHSFTMLKPRQSNPHIDAILNI
jgi:hypothetical protein